MSESVRGEGGRVWVPEEEGRHPRSARASPRSERWYFLEEKYPKYRNLVPRDIATREIFHVCRELGMGIGGRDGVYLDVTHIPARDARREARGRDRDLREVRGRRPAPSADDHLPGRALLDGRAVGDFEPGPNLEPLAGSPHNQATNIPGLYAVGRGDYQYHGANRLGANSLLSCIYGGHDRRPGDGQLRQEQRPELATAVPSRSSRPRRSSGPSASPASARWTARRTRTCSPASSAR